MVESPLSLWDVLTVISRRIFSRVIWHSSLVEVKIVRIFCISVDKILWLCDHELVSEWFCSPTVVKVIMFSPSDIKWKVLSHERISLKMSPLTQAPLYHVALVLSDLVWAPGLLHGSVSLCQVWGGQFAADRAPRLIIVTTLAVPDITTLRGNN